jgi:hypothetical protein
MTKNFQPVSVRQPLALALFTVGMCIVPNLAQAFEASFTGNLRYRYELFGQDVPDTESKASTLRLGLTANAKLGAGFSAFAELESVHQIAEDDYNIPTIPSQSMPGFPVIADPEGAELNQGYLAWAGPLKTVVKVGRQEVKMNEGRFISNSFWRQNHQSFDAATLVSAPFANTTVELGYLSKVLRVVGGEATNGRAEMSSEFFQFGYTVPKVGTAKVYGVFLDFDKELTNSVDTVGARFDLNYPLSNGWSAIGTLDYAKQKDAGSNPNDVDAAYRLIELGVKAWGIDFIAGNALLEGKGATDKFITPLAHPFNGLTEFFLVTPTNGLDATYLKAAGPVPGVKGVTVTAVYYDYQSDSGSLDFGREFDFDIAWKAEPIAKNLIVGWRFAQYSADTLFSDAVRTSLWAAYAF